MVKHGPSWFSWALGALIVAGLSFNVLGNQREASAPTNIDASVTETGSSTISEIPQAVSGTEPSPAGEAL